MLVGGTFPRFCAAWLGSATEYRLASAFLTGMLHLIVLSLAEASHLNGAVAAGTEVLLTCGHGFDVSFFCSDSMHHHRLAFAANHRQFISWFKGLGVGRRRNAFQRQVGRSAFGGALFRSRQDLEAKASRQGGGEGEATDHSFVLHKFPFVVEGTRSFEVPGNLRCSASALCTRPHLTF